MQALDCLLFEDVFSINKRMVIDLVVLGILLVSAAVAFMRGFVREVLTIGSLAGAGAATFLFGPNLTPVVRGWLIDPNATEPQTLFGLIPYEMLCPVIAFALVFGIAIVLFTIGTHLIARGVHSVGLGPVDRSLGVCFGLVRGAILIGLMGLVLNFVLSDEQRQTYFGESKTYPAVTYTAELMQALLPDRDVLEKKAKKGAQTAVAKIDELGKGPLEPGQKGKGRTTNTESGYSALQRRALDKMMAPAAGDTEEQRPAQRKKNYND